MDVLMQRKNCTINVNITEMEISLMEITIVGFLFNIFITLSTYLAIPIIIILIGKGRTNKLINWISVINLIAVFLLWSVFHFFTDGIPANSTAALLWSSIGNWLMKKKIGHIKPRQEPQPVSEKQNRYDNIAISVLVVLLISCILFALIFSNVQ